MYDTFFGFRARPFDLTPLNESHLSELDQHVALQRGIRPLTAQETREYIAGRVEIAGGSGSIFLDEAVQLIHDAARGVPHAINVIADNSLRGAFAAGRAHVDADMVREVCRNLNIAPGRKVDGLPDLVPSDERSRLPTEEFPEFAPVAAPPRTTKRLVLGSAAALALLLAVFAINAGIIGPEATQLIEPADVAEPVVAAGTQVRSAVAPLDVRTPITTDRPVLDLQPAAAPPAVPVSARANAGRDTPSPPVARPSAAASLDRANASRAAPPPPVARPVPTRVPALVSEQTRTSEAGARAVTRTGAPVAPPVSPPVTAKPLSPSSMTPGPPASEASLPSADRLPGAVADATVAGPTPRPPPPAPVAASTPPPNPAPAALETADIQTVLARYRRALETLSASGIETVWPTVNTGTLQRAFDQLSAQSIQFDSCAIDVTTPRRAEASCRGQASVVRKVGGGEPRFEPRQWTFHLSRANAGWIIERVESR